MGWLIQVMTERANGGIGVERVAADAYIRVRVKADIVRSVGYGI